MRAHLQQGYDVYPVNPHADEVEGLPCYARLADIPVEHLDRISVYVPPEVGLTLLQDIADCGADEVWFNPGSDSEELITKAEALGINVIRACSIVNVGLSPGQL